jgi:hypothetical protein
MTAVAVATVGFVVVMGEFDGVSVRSREFACAGGARGRGIACTGDR